MATEFAKHTWLDNGDDIFNVIGKGGNVKATFSMIDAQSAREVVNVNGATSNTTLTAANVSGARSVVLHMNGNLAGAANAQLPTVAALVAVLPGPVTSPQAYRLRIARGGTGAFAWTVTTNTGWTLAGGMTIGQNLFRDFAVIFASPTAATLQSLGGSDGAL